MQYDNPTTADDVRTNLEANEGLSADTLSQIESILGIAPGGSTTEVNVGTFDGTSTTAPEGNVDLLIVTPPSSGTIEIPEEILGSASAYVFQTDYDIEVTFNTVERVIASGNGDDKITVNGDKNTTLDGSDGNDTLITSGGNDSVTGGEGNDSISTGAGNDTIVSGEGNDTVDGGEGLDIVQMTSGGAIADYTISVQDGKLVVQGATASLEATNVEIVSFGEVENVIVSGDQDIADGLRMYEGVLGRSADLDGAQAWINGMNDTLTLQQLAEGFLSSAEFEAKGVTTNEAFVDMLYTQALHRAAEETGRDAWLDGLENGLSWVDVAIGIVGSEEANDVTETSFLISGQV